MTIPRTLLLFVFFSGLLVPSLFGQNELAKERASYIKATYTKYEYEIPMRDGLKLFTAVYVPKDEDRDFGIMLQRTPYSVGPYGVDHYRTRLGPSEKFAREGFIFAYQDVRGRFLSEGEFQEMTPHVADKSGPNDVDESTDTYDTIDWLVHNIPNNNGRVGMWGISYPGFYTAAGMIDAHPALVAASPQAPVTDLYLGDDCFHNGAFMMAANFGFFQFFQKHDEPRRPKPQIPFDYQTKDAYQFFLEMGPLSNAEEKYFKGENPYWTEMMEHPTYDEFWQKRSIAPHIAKVPPAVTTVGGWFDAEDPIGPFLVYRAIEKNDPDVANHLVMGPWAHGAWARGDGDKLGNVSFHSKTAEFYRDHIEFPFFDRHLKTPVEGDEESEEAEEDTMPKAWVFETGTNRWRKFDSWPPAETKERNLYFHDDGKLSFESPQEESAFDEYVSDPSRPVPFIDGIALGVPRPYMVGDQRFASKRTDVLVYQTEPLTEDLAVAGPVTPEIWVSTSGTDSDFVVKLIDVYPHDYPNPDPNPEKVQMGGYQQLVRGEPFRAKYRNSMKHPEPMVPGEWTRIRFKMPDICHVFRRGHRIMVQVQSSWFPLVDRNPQTFVDIPKAKPEDFKRATQRVSRSPVRASAIGLPVLK